MFRKDDHPTVYTTRSGRMCPRCGKPIETCICKRARSASGGDGIVRLHLQSKGRKGKTVTLVTGLGLPEDALGKLASELKRQCGTGGTVKDGVIEIQGDHREMLMGLLKSKGFQVKKAGG